jgi:hypothetical protein
MPELKDMNVHSNTRIKQSTRLSERVNTGGLQKHSEQKAGSCWQPIRPTLFRQRAIFGPPLIARNVKVLDFGNYAAYDLASLWNTEGRRSEAKNLLRTR